MAEPMIARSFFVRWPARPTGGGCLILVKVADKDTSSLISALIGQAHKSPRELYHPLTFDDPTSERLAQPRLSTTRSASR